MSRIPEHSTSAPSYDPITGSYQTTFGPQTQSPSTAIVTAVAALTDDRPQSLPPLYDAICPDALDILFQPARTGGTPPDARLSFTYCHQQITVKASGHITLTPHEHTE